MGETVKRPPGMRRGIFCLEEGDLTIQWPEPLSLGSVELMEEYLAVALRRVRRLAEQQEATAAQAEAAGVRVRVLTEQETKRPLDQ